MKILIVGANKSHSLERVYLTHLKNIGIETALFDARSYVDNFRSSFFNKIRLKLGDRNIYRKIGRDLLRFADCFDPTVVLVFKGMELSRKTLFEIKKRNLFLVNYNPDHPFIFSSKGSGNRNVARTGKIYDLHLTYGQVIANEIKIKLKVPCELLPFGFDLDEELFLELEGEKEVNRICFIGHPDEKRARIIDYLASNNIPLTVFGKNWSKHLNKLPNLEINDEPLYGNKYWATLRRYRGQLNIFREHNFNAHNMRSFEIPAVGGIMLSNINSDHNTYFINDHSFFEYVSDEDMVLKCKRILSMSNEEAKKIRINSREASILNNYSYFARTKLLISIIKSYV